MRRHISLILILLTLASLPLATLPARPAAAQLAAGQPAAISLFGMNTYFTGRERIGRDGSVGVATLIERGRQIGVAWAREELSWGNIERDGKGRWQWADIDLRLADAARGGYGIVGMLLTTPAWARVGDCGLRTLRYAYAGVRADDYWCPPANPQDFADYVRATVERYDGDGVDDAPGSPRVAVWQIWNEPNAWETWPGSPAEFAAIWQAGYAAAKSADPTATVASPGLYVFDGHWRDSVGHGDGLRFFDEALAAIPALWGSFDALAIHPYMPDVAPQQPGIYGAVTFWGRLSTARAWLAERTLRYGGPPRPLWISEVGWSTCTAAQSDCYVGSQESGGGSRKSEDLPPASRLLPPASRLPPPAPLVYTDSARPRLEEAWLETLIGKSEAEQASYLVQAYGLAMAAGVQHVSWFQLEDKFDGAAGNFWEEAAIFGTRAEGYRAKTAAQAYATAAGLLGGARFLGFGALNSFAHSPSEASQVARFHLRFLSADNRIVDLIWRNSGGETIDLPLEPGRGGELRDTLGQPLGLTLLDGAARLAVGESPIYLIQSLSPGLSVAPAALTVIMQPDDPPQQLTITVANSGSGTISWAATSSAAWATVQTSAGQGHSSPLSIRVDPTGLAIGDYSATLQVSSAVGVRDIPLQLVVSEQVFRQYAPFVGR